MPFKDLSQRFYLDEWMDGPCSEQELRACLSDLEEVNECVFVYQPTLAWLATLLPAHPAGLHLVDVGCGSGDMLRTIEKWALDHSLPIRLTGVDRNERSLRFAQERTAVASSIRYVQGDAAAISDVEKVDIVISTHLAHHLSDEEIVSFLEWMERAAGVGWFINDLHRERVPYIAFHLLARCMNWHPFIRHDGPVSVLRSFQPDDWTRYLTSAGIEGATLRPAFPGRLCVERTRQHA
jgi:2-polyprenyl-3-methyl-5-hydroxy-6-metoxy-1,4-benzoquinol methylase